jgi:superoxide dismutase, Cu-Zn family
MTMTDATQGSRGRRLRLVAMAVAGVAAAGLAGPVALTALPAGANGNRATAQLIDTAGEPAGVVTFTQVRGGVVQVDADVTRLTGFHGFHVHAGASCDPTGTPPFISAAGHYHGTGDHQHADHGRHAGDLPSLLARTDGGGVLSFETDKLTVDEIVGRTVIVHQGPDNFANIPARYGVPDATTMATGDAGGRRYCGEIRRGGR